MRHALPAILPAALAASAAPGAAAVPASSTFRYPAGTVSPSIRARRRSRAGPRPTSPSVR